MAQTGVDGPGANAGPCPGTTRVGESASTRSREARSTSGSGANGSSAGPRRSTTGACTRPARRRSAPRVVMSCGVWPGVSSSQVDSTEAEALRRPVVPHVVRVDRPVVVEPRARGTAPR